MFFLEFNLDDCELLISNHNKCYPYSFSAFVPPWAITNKVTMHWCEKIKKAKNLAASRKYQRSANYNIGKTLWGNADWQWHKADNGAPLRSDGAFRVKFSSASVIHAV